MNVKLLLGVVLFVIGLATAVVGIAEVGRNNVDAGPAAVVAGQPIAQPQRGGGPDHHPADCRIITGDWRSADRLERGQLEEPRTNPKPGDEVVNPEGYHKMKHV